MTAKVLPNFNPQFFPPMTGGLTTGDFKTDYPSLPKTGTLKLSDPYAITTQNPMTDLLPSESTEATLGFSLPAALSQRLKKEERALRVTILECSGGQGHKKSADAVESAVKEHFEKMNIAVDFRRKDVGSHMAPDPLGKMTFGKYNMIDFHNQLARNGKTKIIKTLTTIGKFFHKFYFPFNVQYFNERLEKDAVKNQTPDLIISAVPMVNGPLLKSVQGKDIPVLVVTTDPDNELFSVNWPTEKDLPPHRYCIPYNSLEIAQKVNSAVDPKNIRGVGYPVRSEFLASYSEEDLASFRKELGIEEDKKVVGVMMGGLGGKVTLKYFDAMADGIKNKKLKHNDTHFTYFCGTNEEMQSSLLSKAKKAGFKLDENFKGEGKKLVHESGVTISIVGFTKNVHKHMALSKTWVTKPGSSSFNEALCMAVPMLFDNTSDPLPWEALNFDLAETYNFGERVTKFGKFIDQLNTMLEPENNKEYHESMVQYRKDRPAQKNFSENIVKLTYELLKEAEEVKKAKKLKAEKEKLMEALNAPAAEQTKKTALDWIIGAGKAAVSTALKVYKFAVTVILSPIAIIGWGLKWVGKALIDYAFFSGFNMDKDLKKKRRRELIRGIRHSRKGGIMKVPHRGKPLEGLESPLHSSVSKSPIDALYIKSGAKERTGNAVIFVLGKEYQNFHPKNYDHLLNDGADVVLFNPSANSANAMASDLKTLIGELKRKNPDQKLLLHSYCIGAHVAASVASDIAAGNVEELDAQSLPVIVDRGYGDGYKLAKKVAPFVKLPFAKKYINKYYNNKTLKNIEKHKGAMLFLTAKDGNDLLTHQKLKGNKVRNHTKELRDNHKYGINKLIELQNADHWSPWTYEVQNEVKEFLKDQEIIRTDYKKFDEQDTGGFPKRTTVPWFRRHVLPLFL